MKRSLVMAAALAAAMPFGPALGRSVIATPLPMIQTDSGGRGKGKGRSKPGRNYFGSSANAQPHQGPGECERRRRQINSGQLTASNGLVRDWPGVARPARAA